MNGTKSLLNPGEPRKGCQGAREGRAGGTGQGWPGGQGRKAGNRGGSAGGRTPDPRQPPRRQRVCWASQTGSLRARRPGRAAGGLGRGRPQAGRLRADRVAWPRPGPGGGPAGSGAAAPGRLPGLVRVQGQRVIYRDCKGTLPGQTILYHTVYGRGASLWSCRCFTQGHLGTCWLNVSLGPFEL